MQQRKVLCGKLDSDYRIVTSMCAWIQFVAVERFKRLWRNGSGSGRFSGQQSVSSTRLSGISAFLRQQIWLGMEQLYAGSQYRKRSEDSKMDAWVYHLYFATDHFIYLWIRYL